MIFDSRSAPTHKNAHHTHAHRDKPFFSFIFWLFRFICNTRISVWVSISRCRLMNVFLERTNGHYAHIQFISFYWRMCVVHCHASSIDSLFSLIVAPCPLTLTRMRLWCVCVSVYCLFHIFWFVFDIYDFIVWPKKILLSVSDVYTVLHCTHTACVRAIRAHHTPYEYLYVHRHDINVHKHMKQKENSNICVYNTSSSNKLRRYVLVRSNDSNQLFVRE